MFLKVSRELLALCWRTLGSERHRCSTPLRGAPIDAFIFFFKLGTGPMAVESRINNELTPSQKAGGTLRKH